MEKITKKNKVAHHTVDNFCCACEYDLAVFKNKLKILRQELLKKIEEDLEYGKFYMICSNEKTFKDYIKELLK